MEQSRYWLGVLAFMAVGWDQGFAAETGVAERPVRSRVEVLALVETAGTTRPDWWDSVPLEYPATLDLKFPHPPPTKDWRAHENVGQYMWSVINENPARYRQGTKFMHFVMKLNEKDPGVVRRCQEQLAHCYHDLLQDWARAAYWKQKLGVRDVTLAHCYWMLGNKAMAAEVLDGIQYDYSRYGEVIKLWADMGELERALAVAQRSEGLANWGAAARAAGDALRKFGRYDEAILSFRKVLAIESPNPDNLILKHNQDHARMAIQDLQLYETFDLLKVVDGSFEAGVPAYNGELVVRVTVESHRISDVTVVKHSEKQFYSSLTDMPAKIVEAQDFRGVDATTGATVTAEAIKSATARALRRGRKGE
ncbi:MAG: FMN-binding protein [Verrucomicrobiales bacterium]|nr:FMN-binding protein [Verrucomicrobiales bacterium]